MESVQEIPLSKIFADHNFNCRGMIRGQDVVDLMRSIEKEGLLSPILVQPYSDPEEPQYEFRIVAGYRRFTAMKALKKETVPALIKVGLTEDQARILNLTENLKRKDLNKLQEAHALEPMFLKGYTDTEVADAVGMSYGWVQVRRYILDMDEHIQNEIAAGLITDQEVRHLYSITDDARRHEYVREIKRQKLSGKRKADLTLERVKKAKNSKRARSPVEILDMVEKLVALGFGGTLTTIFGAWAGANTDDYSLHKKISQELALRGIFYEIPEHIMRSATEQGMMGTGPALAIKLM